MRLPEWELRCYAQREAPGVWVALCLDFDLAAQGETFEEARAHLDAMIDDYVADALTGEDRDHAMALLNRRAPWRYWLRYFVLSWVRSPGPSAPSAQPFRESDGWSLKAFRGDPLHYVRQRIDCRAVPGLSYRIHQFQSAKQ